jgi:hypothetical protein
MHGLMIPPQLAPKLASRHHVRSIDDYESITTRRQAEYFTYLLEGRTQPANPSIIFAGMLTSGIASRSPDGVAMRRRLLDLAGLRIVAAPTSIEPTPAMRAIVAASSLRTLASPRPDFVLYENPHAVPRAYVVHGVEPAPAPSVLLARLSDPRFDPLAVSYVEGPMPGPPAADGRPGHPATIVRDDAEFVEVEATLAAPGLVVLADAVYPGWTVTVDGVPSTILPTNHLFRGVAVGAGTHRIRFAYRPVSVLAGAIATALGACGIVGLWWAGRRRPDAGAGHAGIARTIWAA